MFDFILYHCLNKSIGKLDTLSQRLDYKDISHDNEDMILLKLEYLTVYTIKELVIEEEEYSLLLKIHWNNRLGQQKKSVACIAREQLLNLIWKEAKVSGEISTRATVMAFFSTSKAACCIRFQIHILLLLVILKRGQVISEKPWINLW